MTAVKVEGLRKAHGARQVLHGIDAHVDEGETIALVGPSGGGKSTFLRCLNGLTSFDAGAVRVAGVELRARTAPDAPQLRALRTRVGMVFQSLNLFPHLTALENVALAPVHVRGEPHAKARARAAELLARVGLGDRGDARPAQLSGGQQQRVASRGRWRWTRRCCSSTSRPARSTRRCAARCSPCCAISPGRG